NQNRFPLRIPRKILPLPLRLRLPLPIPWGLVCSIPLHNRPRARGTLPRCLSSRNGLFPGPCNGLAWVLPSNPNVEIHAGIAFRCLFQTDTGNRQLIAQLNLPVFWFGCFFKRLFYCHFEPLQGPDTPI